MIPQNFADAFARVKELVSIFSQNEQRYLSPGYSEAQARLDFIDKFWIALGWDVAHENQTDPYKQEVKVERGVATNEWRKRSDYAFLAPNFRDVRFYVEAKKPHVGLDNADYYFQTIRYGWNSHTPLAVLTDFEELRVLDCRYKPDITTALGNAVLKYHYTDYADEQKFRTIYYLFSRESVLEGSIESFAQGLPKLSRKRALRGAARDEHQDIDEAFLKELDEYREELARAFKRKNPELESEALTEVTQRTLDRLVFMRFLEDKLIETEPLIEELHRRGNAWVNFVATSRRLDRVYNGIIFKEHSLLDSPGFGPDGRSFDKITQNLSHTNSPYDFNAIPIHILGSIYERFLGKVIVATAKRATVEEKPEVRKAGGVYYTPEYIVRYIVDNTVGKLIEGKTPEEIRQMHFADIACGSGSFLLGVYDTLLRYHTAYYNRNKRTQNEGRKAGCLPTEEGALRLSLLQRRTILLNNIYGVDIDHQAVEVAQLSLYLKLLEDETTASAHQMALRQALLPSLSKNIVSGNSLIGWDILEGKLFDSSEERSLNPMNFEDAFPEVMKRGGFDAIVGNPPYVLGRETFDVRAKRYLATHYGAFGGKYDLYIYFTERAVSLLRPQGVFGYILPNTILANENATNLRRIILDRTVIEVIKTFGSRVFSKAQVESAIIIAKKDTASPTNSIRVEADKIIFIPQSLFTKSTDYRFNIHSDPSTVGLIKRIESKSIPLGDLTDICIGIQLGGSSGKDTKESFLSTQSPDATYKKVLDGKNINRYQMAWSGVSVRYGDWLHRKRDEKYFLSPKIAVRQIGKVPIATYDDGQFYTLNTIYNIINSSSLSLKFLLGIINSKLGQWFWMKRNFDYKALFPKIKKAQIEVIPIHALTLTNPSDRGQHDRMVQLVTQMLDAKQQLASAQTERDKNFYESKCASLDRQIDNLVYELYDLTPEEIAIVEGQSK